MGMLVAVLKVVRLSHLYVGVFIAPAIVFFAFTGALQTLSLHVSAKGSAYKPANWIIVLAQLHKRQTTDLPTNKLQTPASSSTVKPGAPDKTSSLEKGLDRPAHNSLPLKIFFLSRECRPIYLDDYWPLHVLQVQPQQGALSNSFYCRHCRTNQSHLSLGD
jgi:hypothetical protein